MKVALIGCGKTKQDGPCMAKDLYQGQLFKGAYNYAANVLKTDKIYILSAKHHLLKENTVVEKYDVTLNTMRASEIKEWAAIVAEQLQNECDLNNDDFIILASDKYRKYLLPNLTKYQIPMLGKKIGEQLHFFAANK